MRCRPSSGHYSQEWRVQRSVCQWVNPIDARGLSSRVPAFRNVKRPGKSAPSLRTCSVTRLDSEDGAEPPDSRQSHRLLANERSLAIRAPKVCAAELSEPALAAAPACKRRVSHLPLAMASVYVLSPMFRYGDKSPEVSAQNDLGWPSFRALESEWTVWSVGKTLLSLRS
jgi:hypothetical protein